jgi:regulator of sigma E protease
MEILKIALIGIASLSLLVFIHELGHFLPARWFGMRVDKFFLFFDWPRKLFSFKRGGTEYGVGLLPLGGYVKINGMIDESMDKSWVQKPPQPWEFRAKPVWQKAIVMVGGVTMNVLLAWAIFTGLNLGYGDVRNPIGTLRYGLDAAPGSPAEALGFRPGDQIVSVSGRPIQYLEDLNSAEVFLGTDVVVEVRRAGQPATVQIPNDFVNVLAERGATGGPIFMPNAPAIILFDTTNTLGDHTLTAAYRAGLRLGDTILRIDSVAVGSFGEIRPVLAGRGGDTLLVEVMRGGEVYPLPVALDSTARLGVLPDYSYLFGTEERVTYGIGAAIGKGWTDSWRSLSDNLRGFGKVLSGDADVTKSVQGPVGIFKTLGTATISRGWEPFWRITAILSMWLAFINLLPIPALDGGHLMFLGIEAVIGREPSLKFRMIAQQIGMFLLLGLMAFIIFNDLLKLW